MGRYTKKDAIRIVSTCAKQYREHLVNRSLLFLCMDKHGKVDAIEFTFDISNFLHLTGLKLVNRKWHGSSEAGSKDREISASDFYEKCLNHKLREDDFYFSKDGTTELKLDVLPSLLTKNLTAKMVGDFHSDKPKLLTEKLAGGQVACMGFTSDRKTGRFVPNTVIKDDIRKHTCKPLRVIACYRKNRGDSRYGEVTYLASGIDWDTVEYPAEYTYLKNFLLVTHM